ncbi:M48 family metallopeptidase [bacterium]|nr:M48 family metallopeptidase [bacterium]
MAGSATIEIDRIGPVFFERSRRARHLVISIKPVRGVRVAVPYGVTFENALTIVHAKIPWILKHLARMKKSEHYHKKQSVDNIGIDPIEAARKLVRRLRELSIQHGLPFKKVTIRNQRTRWGSCSSKNSISLNMNLVKLPDDLIDYVLIHELVHTRIKNHSIDFWTEMNRHISDARLLSKRLKKYCIEIL